jgi:hypothetical protein
MINRYKLKFIVSYYLETELKLIEETDTVIDVFFYPTSNTTDKTIQLFRLFRLCGLTHIHTKYNVCDCLTINLKNYGRNN